MNTIQEINWNNFRAKFFGKEEKSFETLCYLLFCSEFNEDKGIFRYKNQTGSETDPIERDDNVIAWQAKFLESSISSKKKELMEAITATKRKNPSVNKILFYLNREFSESRSKDKKDPAYKIEIEKHAESLGATVEWRVPSHFERQLALEKNRTLAQHFFSLGKGIVDFITELSRHTDSILAPIHSKMVFNGTEIKIDRSETLKELQSGLESSSMIILSGQGGTGKTAVIKDFYDQLKGSVPFFVLKASEFNITNVNELFAHYGPFGLSVFNEEHKSIAEKYIVIDSAEKLSDIKSQAVFHEFLSRLLETRWKIIFTTRLGRPKIELRGQIQRPEIGPHSAPFCGTEPF
jgi:ATPase subunit of ABC transporter with duplicated ATPase domains